MPQASTCRGVNPAWPRAWLTDPGYVKPTFPEEPGADIFEEVRLPTLSGRNSGLTAERNPNQLSIEKFSHSDPGGR